MRYHYFFRFLVRVACLFVFLGSKTAYAQFSSNLGNKTVKTGTSQPFYGKGNSTESLLEQAGEARNLGRLELAEELYQNLLIKNSANLEAMIGLSETYEIMGKLEYARGLLIRASTLDPFNDSLLKKTSLITMRLSKSLRSEVDSLILAGSYDLAIPKLAILLTLEPENPDLYYKKALCHFELGRPDIANLEIEKALRLNDRESYHQLHEEIHIGLRKREIHTLLEKTQSLLQSDSIRSKQEIMSSLGKILELDPDNEWAREQFLRISETESPREGLKRLEPKARSLPASVWNHLFPFLKHSRELILKLARSAMLYPQVIFLAALVLLILFSPLSRVIISGIPPRSLLAGRLSQFSLHEILTLINSQACTGILSIKSKSISGDVFFEDGEPYHCEADGLMGKEALRMLLRKVKDGHFNFKPKSSAVEKTIETPLSLIIMDLPDRKNSPQVGRRIRRSRSKLTELLESKKE